MRSALGFVVIETCLAVGCVGSDPDGATPVDAADASVGDGASPTEVDAGTSSGDAAVDADSASNGRCDAKKPFGSIEPVAELNTAGDDFAAFLTDDEKDVYWATTVPDGGVQGGTVILATRASDQGPFTGKAPVPALRGPDGTNQVWLTNGTLTALVTYTSSWQLHLGTRSSTQNDFTGFLPLTTLNQDGFVYSGSLRFDGNEIYFESPRTGSSQIYVSTGSGTTFAAPSAFSQAAASNSDGSPVLTKDGLGLYFGSTRPTTAGGSDTWMTHRASLSSAWGPPVRLDELASNKSDLPTWISPDECVIYFARGSVGTRDIYRARRPQ